MEGAKEPEGKGDARRASSEPTTQGSGEFTETRAASTGLHGSAPGPCVSITASILPSVRMSGARSCACS